jgi:PAS domain S-box-containing protein
MSDSVAPQAESSNHTEPSASRTLRVLIAEDSNLDTDLLVRELKRSGYSLTWKQVTSAAEFEAALSRDSWDLVLSDYVMPGFSGLAALELLKASGLDLPFILISGTIGEETAVEALKAGAHDYLMKDRLARLGAAVARGLRDAEERQARRKAQAEARLLLEAAQEARRTLQGVVDDHEKTQEALWAERNLLRTLVDHLPVSVYAKDTAGRMTLVNLADASHLGVASPSEALGKTDFDFYPHAQAEAFQADDQQVLQKGEPVLNREELLIRPDGARVWLLTSKVPLRNALGRITGLVGMGLDITKRRVVEETLRRRLACEVAAIACMRMLVEPTDLDSVLPEVLERSLEASDASRCYIFQNEECTEAGLCTSQIHEVVADGIQPQIDNPKLRRLPYHEMAPSLLPILQARQPFVGRVDELPEPEQTILANQGIQSVLILPIYSGSSFWGFLGFDDCRDGRLWDDHDIQLLQVVADGIGMTIHRLEAEAQLRLQSSALEAAANAIVITNREGVIEWANPAFTAFSGYALNEAIGQKVGSLVKSGKHDPAFYRALWDAVLGGNVWRGEIINRRKDGTLFTEEMTITPLKNAHGEIAHFIAVKQDVTQRKSLEEQFRQAHKMQAIGQLAGGVAHDFNNMLGVILMNASLLLSREGLDEEAVEHLRQILNAAERSANLTRQLLLFSRRQVMQPRVLELGEVVSGMVKMLQRIIGEDVALQTRFAPGSLRVHADPGMIEQVLLNLAVNARDAMPEGGEIAISLEPVALDGRSCPHPNASPGNYVRLRFSDTGCGIAPEHLGQIFNPFFTTKDVDKGTGLGLATVYGILEQHQGWIDVESQPGQGTSFVIHLPQWAQGTSAKDEDEAPVPVRGGDETILLVEDELVLRMLAARVLERHGYKVIAAPSGAAALGIWEEHRAAVALLLTDVVMPDGVSGGKLAEQLRAQKPALKVLFMSGYTGEIAGRGLNLREGVNFLQKPFSPTRLAQVVRDCLDAAPASRP